MLEAITESYLNQDITGYSAVLNEQETYWPTWPSADVSLWRVKTVELEVSYRSHLRYLTIAEQQILDRALRRSVKLVHSAKRR